MACMDGMRIAEGFQGQAMHGLPRPLLAEAARHVLAAELHPTDIGWFPRARGHFRERPAGAAEHILIVCVAGSGWFEIDGRRGVLRRGGALWIAAGRPHAYGASERDPWSIHWVHLAGEDAAWFAGRVPGDRPVIPVAPGALRRAALLFRECCGAFAGGATVPRVLFASQVLRHLLAVLFHDNPRFTPGVPAASHRDFQGSIDHMRARLREGVTLAELARRAGLSPSRYSFLFKAATGHSPVEHFIRLRLQAAARLLDTTDRTVKEVAAMTGYDDPFHFSRAFRRVTGQSPRAYRRTAKG